MLRRERIDGVELAFQDEGEQGQQNKAGAIVLLHAFPVDHRVWADNVPPLVAAGHRVVAIDYPGFGASPSPPAPWSIADLARLVVGLLDRLKLASATVVGESMGGYAALALAAQAPTRLERLVLADTRATADAAAARLGRANALESIRTRGVPAFLDGSVPRLLAPDAVPALVARVRALAETRAQSLLDAVVALRDRPDRSGELGAIRCPTLAIVGAADQVTPPADVRQMADGIAGARFVEIPGAGHLSNIEAPAAFNRALLDFLSTTAGGGAS